MSVEVEIMHFTLFYTLRSFWLELLKKANARAAFAFNLT
jgi:hypothetical protein